MKYLIFLIIFFIISCKSERANINITTNEEARKIGVDVKIDIAEKKIIGKWVLIRASNLYEEFKLTKPADITFNEDKTYTFNITLKDKGKLSYRGKWKLEDQNNLLLLILERKQRAFEGDWKDAEANEGGYFRFLNTDYKSALINITNLSWYPPAISEDLNNYWEKEEQTHDSSR